MKKVERLELENQVLKNAIDCVLETIEINKRIGEEEYFTLTEVKAILDLKDRMQYALERKETIDYRKNARTIEDCESRFENFKTRVILNDGMVVGFEY